MIFNFTGTAIYEKTIELYPHSKHILKSFILSLWFKAHPKFLYGRWDGGTHALFFFFCYLNTEILTVQFREKLFCYNNNVYISLLTYNINFEYCAMVGILESYVSIYRHQIYLNFWKFNVFVVQRMTFIMY